MSVNLAASAAGGTAGARRDSDQHDQNDDDQCADTEQCDDEGQVQKHAVVVLSVVVVSCRPFLGVDDGRVHVDDEVDVAGARRITVVARRHSQRNGLEHDVRQIGARSHHAARTEIHV